MDKQKSQETYALAPKDRWGFIREIDRVRVAGADWVVYSDGEYRWAINAKDFDACTDEQDYTEWSVTTAGAEDVKLCALIAREAGLRGISACGNGRWVDAAPSLD